jgi:ABC-2 type transport system ATP-binding protein
VARSTTEAHQALALLISRGIELDHFSMGSPSLDEVFFALTGNKRAMSNGDAE